MITEAHFRDRSLLFPCGSANAGQIFSNGDFPEFKTKTDRIHGMGCAAIDVEGEK